MTKVNIRILKFYTKSTAIQQMIMMMIYTI
jgi:hypothetical protein